LNLHLGNKILSTDDILSVIDATFGILERTGLLVENAEILARLADFGAIIDRESSRVRFKRPFLESFVNESDKADWEHMPVCFTTAAEIFHGYYLDAADGLYKEWTEQRLLDYVKLSKALPNVDGASMLGCPIKEVPAPLQPLYEKLYGWKYGIGGCCSIWDTALCQKIHDMCQVYADTNGRNARDIFAGAVYLVSPLKFGSVEAEQFMWFFKKGLAVSVGTMGILGGTTPVTLAGALALHMAEVLFTNILRRAFSGGSVLGMGNSISVMDMSSGAFQYGRPEQTLLSIAGAQVARHLGVSYGGHGGLTDAKAPGHEAGVQKVSSALMNAMACGHGNIAAGLLGVDEIFSPVQMVLDDEITGSIKRVLKGFEVNDETLALGVIDEVGPGGNFLNTDHTSTHFRDCLWQTNVWSREMYSVWNRTGRRTDMDRARDRALSIIHDGKYLEPEISDETEKRLLKIING
jgi:trimethylamine--corrinoid protein Co-methyltransferase